METLRKLENVQRVLSLINASGISAGQPDSDRFLADFLLFLVKDYNIGIKERCQLIHEHLHQISAALLEEPTLHIIAEEDKDTCFKDCTNVVSSRREMNKNKELALIGFNAMKRANSTLEDFCRSYFMFHGVDVSNPQSIFRFLPILSFTESYIYQLDIVNEKSFQISVNELKGKEKHPHAIYLSNNWVRPQGSAQSVLPDLLSHSFRPLFSLLEKQGLLTKQIKEELESGLEYWALERKLCYALCMGKEILLEDVMRAIHLKSFDYRVLHCLLYQLTGEEVNNLHMEFLSVSELLVEISDDLYDYEEDIVENSFNILRMFARIYGPQFAPSMLAKFISEAEEKYEHLSRALDPDLSAKYQRRCEEATREGGKTSGYTLGTWNMPRVVVDEDSFRSSILTT